MSPRSEEFMASAHELHRKPEKRSRSAKQPIYDAAEITPEEARRIVALADRFVAAVTTS
jgi:hypothetical protein